MTPEIFLCSIILYFGPKDHIVSNVLAVYEILSIITSLAGVVNNLFLVMCLFYGMQMQ